MPWFLFSLQSPEPSYLEFPRPSLVGDVVSEDTLVDWICRCTPPDFRASVRESGRFMYRGASDEELQRMIQQPAPDLLMPQTYGSSAAAWAYFECLEERLNGVFPAGNGLTVAAKPSTGHIATSNPKEAGKWGTTVSVWPLGTQWSYVWPKNRETFYSVETASGKASCVDDELMIESDLVQALQQTREIMFASSGLDRVETSAFLAISHAHDESLRRKLEEVNYGLPIRR